MKVAGVCRPVVNLDSAEQKQIPSRQHMETDLRADLCSVRFSSGLSVWKTGHSELNIVIFW